MKFKSLLLFIFLLNFFTAAMVIPQIPKEYEGKWRLGGSNSKIAGILEIRADNTFTYLILPNYKRTGKIFLRQEGWIDLVPDGETPETFRAIIKVQGNTLDLCIGAANAARPTEFKSDSQQGIIYWMGNK
jgi:hypothetical protein